MKVQRIEHKDGSFSYADKGITILKNKEEKEDQVITEVDVDSSEKAFKQEKQEKQDKTKKVK